MFIYDIFLIKLFAQSTSLVINIYLAADPTPCES